MQMVWWRQCLNTVTSLYNTAWWISAIHCVQVGSSRHRPNLHCSQCCCMHNGDTSQPSNWRPIAVLKNNMQDILAFASQQATRCDGNNKQVIKQVSDPTPGLIRLLIFYACHPKVWSGMPRFGLRGWIWRKQVAVSNTAALHKLVCLVYRWWNITQLNMFKWNFFTQEMRLETWKICEKIWKKTAL